MKPEHSDQPTNESTHPNKQRPPYFCPTCLSEIKPNQKYKHLKKHADNDQSLKRLTTSLATIKTEIQILKTELKNYDFLNAEKQKELAALELALLKKLISK